MTEITVKVNEGFLRGKKSVNYKNGQFYSFFGIPYAQPPLGELRFQPPQTPTKWNGIKDATEEKEGCISRNTFTKKIEGGEDCLFLNVYSSMVNSTNKVQKPVMVWIHGGAFQIGSTKTELYGPEYLLTEDIVLVTVSFRLGALGFLCLEDTRLGVTGNNGLRDIIMALKWVQANITAFLGDPGNVTIFGESSGGVSCHYLMLSPLTKGLFHKIILQSGCALYHWAEGARDSAIRLAKILDLDANTDEDILKLLKRLPVEAIFEGQDKVKAHLLPNEQWHFYPVFEKPSLTGEPAVIAENPIELIRSGRYNKMPMMIGYTSAEGLFFEYKIKQAIQSKERNGVLITNFENLIPHHLKVPSGSILSKYIANEIKSFYFNGEEPTLKYKSKFYEVNADVFFNHRLFNTASMHLENLGHPIYYFRFSVDGNFNFYKELHGSNSPGASHSDDVCYLFKVGSKVNNIIDGSVEDVTIQRMVKLWTNFARFGDPNVKEFDKNISTRWDPIERGKFHFLDIGNDISAGVDPDYERIRFWDNIYKLHPVVGKL